MTVHDDPTRPLAERVRHALSTRDLDAFGALLSDDVTWGDVQHPRGCRNRRDVLATFERVMDAGVTGDITELSTGARGILVGLEVHWPVGSPREDETSLFHVYLVVDDQIVAIHRYDDRPSAADAAGIVADADR